MNIKNQHHLSKWQHMLTIVNQNSALLQLNRRKIFKKIRLLRLLNINILVLFIQFSGLNFSTFSDALPFWFATGTSCAYLFLRGYTVLPGLWLGNFLAYLWVDAGFILTTFSATLLTLQAVLLYWFSSYYLKPTLIFYELKSFWLFILYSALLTGLISFSLLSVSYSFMPSVKESRIELLVQWWLANFDAILIFSCAFITWDAYFPRSYSLKEQSLSVYSLYGLFVITCFLLCCSSSLGTIKLVILFNLMLLVLISYLFAWPGAILALFLSGIILSFGVWFHAAIEQISLVWVQLFLGLQAIIGLSVVTSKIPSPH